MPTDHCPAFIGTSSPQSLPLSVPPVWRGFSCAVVVTGGCVEVVGAPVVVTGGLVVVSGGSVKETGGRVEVTGSVVDTTGEVVEVAGALVEVTGGCVKVVGCLVEVIGVVAGTRVVVTTESSGDLVFVSVVVSLTVTISPSFSPGTQATKQASNSIAMAAANKYRFMIQPFFNDRLVVITNLFYCSTIKADCQPYSLPRL